MEGLSGNIQVSKLWKKCDIQ